MKPPINFNGSPAWFDGRLRGRWQSLLSGRSEQRTSSWLCGSQGAARNPVRGSLPVALLCCTSQPVRARACGCRSAAVSSQLNSFYVCPNQIRRRSVPVGQGRTYNKSTLQYTRYKCPMTSTLRRRA
eukprot:6194112-Pleurochrysis_carterae.AAC.3